MSWLSTFTDNPVKAVSNIQPWEDIKYAINRGTNTGGPSKTTYVPTQPLLLPMPEFGSYMDFQLPPIQAPQWDPLLSDAALGEQVKMASSVAARPINLPQFVQPMADILRSQAQEGLLQSQASASSEFTKRGLESSSTAIQTLTKALPAESAKLLSKATTELMMLAYPLAMQEKQQAIQSVFATVNLNMAVRNMIGDEKFKLLDANQRQNMAVADAKLKTHLAEIEMRFNVQSKNADLIMQAGNMDLAKQQLAAAEDERKRGREIAIGKALGSIGGAVIGGIAGATTGNPMVALMGAGIGSSVGSEFGSLFPLS